MGCCLSKKDPCSKSLSSRITEITIPKTQEIDLKIATQKLHNNVTAQIELQQRRNQAEIDDEKREEEIRVEEKKEIDNEKPPPNKKKEVFVIQHRKSHDKRPDTDGSGSGSGSNLSDPESVGRNLMAAAASGQVVRTSSCTKEEVDAILIQCGRLSRSNSGKGNGGSGHGRRYSGSKRSFDFDRENEAAGGGNGDGEGDAVGDVADEERLRRRQSRGANRRSPMSSRERGEQRSGSRERSGSGGRRVSRSPGRRSDSPMSHNNSSSVGSGRPGKLVSVPATVTSLSIDKGAGNVSGGDTGNVKRVLVKRNVGSPRSQSPARVNPPNGSANGNGRPQSPSKGNQVNGNGRSQSPANGNQVNGNGNGRSQSPIKGIGNTGVGGQQPPASISRNGSRKGEHSPYRRTPLNEIDLNSLPFQPLANKRPLTKGKEIEDEVLVVKHPLNSALQNKAAPQATHRRTRSRGAEGYEVTKTNYCRVNDFHTPDLEHMSENHGKDQLNAIEYDAMVTPVILSGNDTLRMPQTLVRSRSARRSRDLDNNIDALLTPTPAPAPAPAATNYTSLLLQDIQKFHQKKIPTGNSNSNTKTDTVTLSNSVATNFTLPACVSKAHSILEAVADLNSTTASNQSFAFSENGKKRSQPFAESEVKVRDDLMEPSLHKYVTVRKRGGDMDDEESSGSNSVVGNGGVHPNWVSSSSWEPNSAESTDCWSSKNYSRDDEFSPVVFQKHTMSDLGCPTLEDSGMKYSKNARDLQFAPLHQTGAARSRTGTV